MSSSTRRWATLLMWLMLALLPLRGWAAGVMDLSLAVPAHEMSAPACHEDTTDDAGSHGHALCDVCHAAAVPAPDPALPPVERSARAAIGWAPIALAQDPPAGLYKPPRR